jgi:dephospho-CoA kinase
MASERVLICGMILAGLTGGVAVGKSTVGRLFQDCGAILVDADVLARQVVEPGKPAWREIVKTFGTDVLRPDRSLNRPALASLVFRAPAKLRTLNGIIHPRVAREQARLCREIARKHPEAVVVYDAALLIEADAHVRMDRVILVTADRPTQLARLRKRDGLSRAEAVRRIRSQMPAAEKRRYADYVLDGGSPVGELREAVRTLYRDLQQQARQGLRPTRRSRRPPRRGTRGA